MEIYNRIVASLLIKSRYNGFFNGAGNCSSVRNKLQFSGFFGVSDVL